MSIPNRCVRVGNEHHVCNCGCVEYEAEIATLQKEIHGLKKKMLQKLDKVSSSSNTLIAEGIARCRKALSD
jgi:hypothetical protein